MNKAQGELQLKSLVYSSEYSETKVAQYSKLSSSLYLNYFRRIQEC